MSYLIAWGKCAQGEEALVQNAGNKNGSEVGRSGANRGEGKWREEGNLML